MSQRKTLWGLAIIALLNFSSCELLAKKNLLHRSTKTTNQFKANFINKNFYIKQGQTVRARIKTNQRPVAAQMKFLSEIYPCFPSKKNPYIYECLIPIQCEGKTGRHKLFARLKNKSGKKQYLRGSINIKKVTFPNQRGFRVSKKSLKNKLKKETGSCQKTSFWKNGKMKKLLKQSPKQPLWDGPFRIPSKLLRYSTPFGEIRNNPYWGRYLHKAVDIVSPVRSPVWATQNGKIIMRERFLYSGNTVLIDHGCGVFSHYFHLDSFSKIKVGDHVKKGEEIGRIGNTGYSAGYHLHWGISVHNELVDPIEWTTKKFA